MGRATVITGMGCVGAYGCGSDSLEGALESGYVPTTVVDRSAGYHLPGGARDAALVGDADLSRWLSPGSARRMSTPSRFAVAAARMALEEAGLEPGGARDATVVMATSFGPVSVTERMLRSIFFEGPEAASALLFTECVANAPAAQVAIACGATGPNVTLAQREAGGLLAVARGATEVGEGRSPVAVVGIVDEMPPLLHALLDRFGALARAGADEQEIPRPFDRDRNGSRAAEGSAVLVIEEEEQALARGARPLARIRAWASAFDPSASRVGWGTGHVVLGSAMCDLLRRAGAAPTDVDAVVSGASGSPAGDRLEARTLRCVWRGDRLPIVLAPKATTGEGGGGFLGASVLAARGSGFAATPGFRVRDHELDVVPYGGQPVTNPRRVLVTSLAAGGAAAFLLLERP